MIKSTSLIEQKNDAGNALEMLRDGVTVRMLGVSEARPEPTLAMHARESERFLASGSESSRVSASGCTIDVGDVREGAGVC